MWKFIPLSSFLLLVSWQAIGADRPPKILTQSPDMTVYFAPGQRLEIPCVAYGTPLPRYQWTVNGVAFNPADYDDRVDMKSDIGTLIFSSVEEKDEGLYQCFATNGIGTAVSDVVSLRKAYIHDNPPQVKVHQVYLDFPLTLRCSAVESLPPATVHWEIEGPDGSGQQLPLSKRVSMSIHGDLYFSNSVETDAENGSIYYCVSTNDFLRQRVKSSGHRITIHGTTKHKFPVSLTWAPPTDMLAMEGQNTTLKCIFSGNPTPDVYWSRGNFSTLSTKVIQSSWGQQVLIPDVHQSDQEVYTCLGINSETATPITHQVNLRVESTPKWFTQPRDIEANPSDTATINCTATGVPPPAYRWFINGVDITGLNITGFINNIERHTLPSVLTVHHVNLTDQMNIQCNATNKHGYIFADIALNVRDPVANSNGNKTVVPSLCTDNLGIMQCAKIKAGGHCSDARIVKFCPNSCGVCTLPDIIG